MKDKQLAIELLDKTFNCDFNTERYSRFIKELFNQFDIKQKERHAWSEFKSHIDTYQYLGSYTDGSKKSIDVLAVKLKRTSSIDRARTKQRNFVAKYLVDNNKDAALVAFYGDDRQDWRFSFVKLDYHLEKEESGKVKPVEELTPAKRYSYLVGVNEPNHTCRSQFLDLIIEEVKNPSIEEIEAAFSIDNVTKVFFSEYNDLFLKLKESLDKIIEKHPHVKEEFDKKNISTVDFSKKLLGQIVFIYFLQKKGWLGVGKDKETGKFKEWGEGPKKFLRKLFNKEIVQYDKFFNEILEPLFYEALSKEYDHNFYSRFDCKIPFLNGGLFEPINDYDWVNVKIPFENKIFEDILETFDRFNFTVKEDEPLDKEVAVDPEMLGKVFENLLTVTDRKSKGAFYTPREIVHYMCQQSLINYLETNTDVPVSDIETFIQYGELAQQISNKIEVEEKYIPASIKKNHNKINDLLKDIKIVDPAVGSGAFPMGMMNEIVKARSILSWLSEDDKPNYYDLKRETIENCLYGVDIDSSAVDITKLRFWLSLVVDESDIKKIKPLPNLDHRIMCGNSLLEEFEGIKLFDEQLLEVIPETGDFELGQVNEEVEKLYSELGEIHTGKRKDNGRKKEIETELKKLDRKKKAILSKPKDDTQQSTFDSVLENRRKESQKKLAELKRLQKAYFNEQGRKRKKELADDIDIIEWELVEETLKEQGNEDAIQKLAQYKKNKSKPFFLWKLYFSDVFQRENPGFDVVIANPPYVRVDDIPVDYRSKYKNNYKSAYGKYDLYYLFFERSFLISSNVGTCVFISPNKFCAADSGKLLRSMFFQKNISAEIVSTSKLGVFDSASNYPIISIIKRNSIKSEYLIREAIDINLLNFNNSQKAYLAKVEDLSIFPDNIIPININQDSFDLVKNIFQGSNKLSEILSISEGLRIPTTIESETKEEFEIVKQYQFSKYSNICEGSYITNQKLKNIISEKSNRYKKIIQEKILIAEDALEVNATIDFNHRIPQGGVYFGVKLLPNLNIKFILSLLNSKLLSFIYEVLFSGMHMGGGYLRYRSKFLEGLPIPKSMLIYPKSCQNSFIDLVDQILAFTKDSDYPDNPQKQARVKTLQKQIDQLVYKLYDLTPEEIQIVEGFNEGK